MATTKTIRGRWGSAAGDVADLELDAVTHALVSMDWEHSTIHSEISFAAFFSNTTANADDHRSCIGFKTPNTTKWSHLVITVSASAAAEFFLEEAPTIDDDDGTEQLIYNRKRISTVTSGLLSLTNPGVANYVSTFVEAEIAAATYTPGTILDYVQLVGSTAPRALGGVSRGTEEWVLDQNVKYVLRMQNIGANINVHTININWYEHTSKH